MNLEVVVEVVLLLKKEENELNQMMDLVQEAHDHGMELKHNFINLILNLILPLQKPFKEWKSFWKWQSQWFWFT